MVYFLRVRKRPTVAMGIEIKYTAGWANQDSTLK